MAKLRTALPALLLTLVVLPSCATNHLLEWSRAEPSLWDQPVEEWQSYVHSCGTVLAFPIVVLWDAVTFPFQAIWSVYPYGEEMNPANEDF